MKKKQSIDGFVPSGNFVKKKQDSVRPEPISKKSKPTDVTDDLADTLRQLDVDDKLQPTEQAKSNRAGHRKLRRNKKIQKKLARKNQKRLQKGKKPLSLGQFKRRRFFKRFLLLLLVILIALGGYYGYRILHNTSRVFDGNIFDSFRNTKLKEDSNGRTNILVFGTSQDGWDGADLTDSIMVLSINQTDYSAYTISLPRDLYVKHDCRNYLGTTAGKLNEAYVCGKANDQTSDEASETAGADELASIVTTVTGLDIQYRVHVNWNVIVQGIDSIGGIDLTIEVYDGSPEMYDYATEVRYKDGEQVHLNGEQALALSRARGAHGGYGISGGNFDREKNQQKIVKAVLEKVNSSGTVKAETLLDLLDALGDNVQTNFQTSEIRALAGLASNFQSDNVKSVPLVDSDNDIQLVTTDNVSGASVVVPVAGLYDYSDIKYYINKTINPDPVTDEEARLVVLNGTNTDGLAAKEQTSLENDGFLVDSVGTAENSVSGTAVYALNDTKPETSKALAEKYNTTVRTGLPSWIQEYEADFVIVLGQ